METYLFSEDLSKTPKYPHGMNVKQMATFLSYNQHVSSYSNADIASTKLVVFQVLEYIEKQKVPLCNSSNMYNEAIDERSDEILIIQLNSIALLKPTDIINVLDIHYHKIFDRLSTNEDIHPKIYIIVVHIFLKVYGHLMLNYDNYKSLVEKLCDLCLLFLKKLIELIRNNLENDKYKIILSVLTLIVEKYIDESIISFADNNIYSLRYIITRFQKLVHKNQIVIFTKLENMTYVSKLSLIKFIFLIFMADYQEYQLKARITVPTFIEYLELKNKQDVWKRVLSTIYTHIEMNSVNDIITAKNELKVLVVLLHVTCDIDKIGYVLRLMVKKLLQASSFDLLKLYILSIISVPGFINYIDQNTVELLLLWFNLIAVKQNKIRVMEFVTTFKIFQILNLCPKVYETRIIQFITDTLTSHNEEYILTLLNSLAALFFTTSTEYTFRRFYTIFERVLAFLPITATNLTILKAIIKKLIIKESSINIVYFVNKFDSFDLNRSNLFVYIIMHNIIIKSAHFIKDDYSGIYELVKEILFDITKKAETYDTNESPLTLEYLKFKEIAKLTKRIDRIDNNTHKILKTLIRNFCYNLKDIIPQNNLNFNVDASNCRLKLPYNLIKVNKFVHNMMALNQTSYSGDILIPSYKNIDTLTNIRNLKILKSVELGGLFEPIQIHLELYYTNCAFFLKIIISNVSSSIIKNLKIELLKNHIDTFTVFEVIEVNNIAPKSSKTYQFGLNVQKIEDIYIQLISNIANIEIDEVDLLDDNENGDENNRMDVSEQSMEDFNHYIIKYEEIKIPFYVFFEKINDEWLIDLLNKLISPMTFQRYLLRPGHDIYEHLKLQTCTKNEWFRSLSYNKFFCITVENNSTDTEKWFLTSNNGLYNAVKDLDHAK